MSVRLIHNDREFAALEDQWNALLRQSRANTIFLTWHWLYSWWQAYGQAGDRLYILLVERQSRGIIGIVPFYLRTSKRFGIVPVRILRFIGEGSSDSDYLDVIAPAGEEHAILEEAWSFLQANKHSWDVLEWTCLL